MFSRTLKSSLWCDLTKSTAVCCVLCSRSPTSFIIGFKSLVAIPLHAHPMFLVPDTFKLANYLRLSQNVTVHYSFNYSQLQRTAPVQIIYMLEFNIIHIVFSSELYPTGLHYIISYWRLSSLKVQRQLPEFMTCTFHWVSRCLPCWCRWQPLRRSGPTVQSWCDLPWRAGGVAPGLQKAVADPAPLFVDPSGCWGEALIG